MSKVCILADNKVRRRGLLAEHGLSLWIEKDGKAILFDTGQSYVFCHNAKEMGINLEFVNYIVISHGHYDHSGGLAYFPHKNSTAVVYVHPDIFLKKYASDGKNALREIGVPDEVYMKEWVKDNIVYTKQPLEIDRGIIISGEIPRLNAFEDTPKGFYIRKNGNLIPDVMMDEQMLIIEDDEIAVFLGCSHPGVVNSLNYVQKLIPNKRIKLLVAGMHLEDAEPSRLQMTVGHIIDMDIQKVVPLHCTGFNAVCEIKRKLGERCLVMCVGDVIEF